MRFSKGLPILAKAVSRKLKKLSMEKLLVLLVLLKYLGDMWDLEICNNAVPNQD